MKIVVKEPGQEPEIREVKKLGLETFQGLVGGYIENVYLENGLILVANEEGLLIGLPANIRNPHPFVTLPIVGTVVGTAMTEESDTRSLTDDEADALCLVLQELSISEAA